MKDGKRPVMDWPQLTQYEEYIVCKARSHESDGSMTTNAGYNSLPWYKCRWCGTRYATQTTTKLLEENIPTPETPTNKPKGK